MNLRYLLLTLGIFISVNVSAEPEAITKLDTESTPEPVSRVYVKTIKADYSKIYKKIFNGLENNGYFVIIEPNIGRNLASFAQRWGNNYNKNKLETIRSLVFCNGGYANEISNSDPNMLALCPLHITLIEKKGTTSILFVRPGQVALNSPAFKIALELEQDVIRVIEEAIWVQK
jgi:uncharacterized protein (DUF302 family)